MLFLWRYGSRIALSHKVCYSLYADLPHRLSPCSVPLRSPSSTRFRASFFCGLIAVLVLSQADARSGLRFCVFCVTLFAEVGDQYPPPTCQLFFYDLIFVHWCGSRCKPFKSVSCPVKGVFHQDADLSGFFIADRRPKLAACKVGLRT